MASVVLAALACLTIVAVVPIRWLDAQLHGTAYSDTMRPLATDAAVQRAIADRLSATLAAEGTGLPPVIVDEVRREIPAMIRTPEVAALWTSASLEIRDRLLTGDGGEVTVDGGDLIDPLADRLGLSGLASSADLPDAMTRIVLVDVPPLGQVRTVARMTPALAYVVPLLAAGLLALALLTARDRWRTLAGIGFVVAAGSVVEMLLIRPIRERALAGIDDETSRAILAAIAGAFSDSLRSALIIPLMAGCVVGVAGLVVARQVVSRAGPGSTVRGRREVRG
ncbi:MAG: hypothetical protein ACRDP8_25455 [Actinopolymorphaceae bacterium]